MATKDQLNQVLAALQANADTMGASVAWQGMSSERAEQAIYNSALLAQWFVPALEEFAKFLIGEDEFFIIQRPKEDFAETFPLLEQMWEELSSHRIWNGEDGYNGEPQQDSRSVALKCFKLSDVVFEKVDVSAQKMTVEKAIDHIKQQRPGLIRSDAGICASLLTEKRQRTLEWIRTRLGYCIIVFPGTKLRTVSHNSSFRRFVLSAEWDYSSERWRAHYTSFNALPREDAVWLLLKPLK